jgi:beta-galactosidase
MWSIGNEVNEQPYPEEGLQIGRALAALARMEDPTRPVTMGNCMRCTITNGLASVVDVFGCNYMPDWYGSFYEAHPDMGMWGSESESMISSRGAYFFPEDVDYSQVTCPQWKGMYDWQVSSYDLFPIRPSNYPPEVEFAAQKAFPQCYGNFVWTGFDYLGECSPYEKDRPHFRYTTPERERHFKQLMAANKNHEPTARSSYYGILDLCGFPKDRYYCYQAEWRPEKPMAHLLPHWTWPERVGKVTPVHAYTSGDEAELFLNGRSLGRKRKADAFRLMWNDVRYEPGELRLVAYKGGRQWAEVVQRTAGPAARLDAQAERRELASLQDLAYVTIALRDEKGTLVPESDVDLSFAATGSVEVIGVCNGDPTDMTGLQADHQRTFHGLCQAVVRLREGAHGSGELKVSGGGLSVTVPFSGPRQP